MTMPADGAATRFPVSVKGILLRGDRVVLMKNPRHEWELPGGKLETGETPEACAVRERAEELGLDVAVGPLADAWVYRIAPGVDVLVLAYGCVPATWPERLASPEGSEVGLFDLTALDGLRLPEGYRRAIRRCAAMR